VQAGLIKLPDLSKRRPGEATAFHRAGPGCLKLRKAPDQSGKVLGTCKSPYASQEMEYEPGFPASIEGNCWKDGRDSILVSRITEKIGKTEGGSLSGR